MCDTCRFSDREHHSSSGIPAGPIFSTGIGWNPSLKAGE